MNLIEKVFKGAIDKVAMEQVDKLFVTQFATAMASQVRGLDFALPTIDADGYDYDFNAFRVIGAVYECTDLISKKVINCPLVFYKVKDKKMMKKALQLMKSDDPRQQVEAHVMKSLAMEEVDNDMLLKLFNNPNPYQNQTQWLWTIALCYLLRGNAFNYTSKGSKKTVKAWCIPNMQIWAHETDLLDPIRGYKMIYGIGQLLDKTFEVDEIYHMKTGNPAIIDNTYQYLYGVSPLRAYLEPMRTIVEANKQASKQVKNGGVFGIISPKDKEDQLAPDQKKQLLEKMKEARQSNDELARVFPSAIALAWQEIGLSMADLRLLELVEAKEIDIYRAYHVPQQYHDQKSSTRDNQSLATRQLIYDAVAPVCDAISEFLTVIGKEYGVDMVMLDYTQLPEMAINMKEVAEYLGSIPEGTLTPNEMRAALRYGEKSEAYMNEHYINKSKVTMKQVADGATKETVTSNEDLSAKIDALTDAVERKKV